MQTRENLFEDAAGELSTVNDTEIKPENLFGKFESIKLESDSWRGSSCYLRWAPSVKKCEVCNADTSGKQVLIAQALSTPNGSSTSYITSAELKRRQASYDVPVPTSDSDDDDAKGVRDEQFKLGGFSAGTISPVQEAPDDKDNDDVQADDKTATEVKSEGGTLCDKPKTQDFKTLQLTEKIGKTSAKEKKADNETQFFGYPLKSEIANRQLTKAYLETKDWMEGVNKRAQERWLTGIKQDKAKFKEQFTEHKINDHEQWEWCNLWRVIDWHNKHPRVNDQKDMGQPEEDNWDSDDDKNEDVKMPDKSEDVKMPAKEEDTNHYEENEEAEQQSYPAETAQYDYQSWEDTNYDETWNSGEAEYGTSYSEWTTQDWSNHNDGYANDCNLADQGYNQIGHEEQLNEQCGDDYDDHNGYGEDDYEENDYGEEEEDYDDTQWS